jgi:hypothetical protein
LKGSRFKGPDGEFEVKKIAEDYKKTIELAKERFDDSYSASTEVAAVLRVRRRRPLADSASDRQDLSQGAGHEPASWLYGRLAAACPPPRRLPNPAVHSRVSLSSSPSWPRSAWRGSSGHGVRLELARPATRVSLPV